MLHLVASLGWDLQQFDIKATFLHGILPPKEIAYIEQPAGFQEPGKVDWVMQLSKSIYSMKQASCIWNKMFHNTIVWWGFRCMCNKWCVYWQTSLSGTTIFAVHVDDIIATSSSPKEMSKFKGELHSCWEISDLGPANFALGITIHCNPTEKRISISQTVFIDRLVEKFNQKDTYPCDTPMVAGL